MLIPRADCLLLLYLPAWGPCFQLLCKNLQNCHAHLVPGYICFHAVRGYLVHERKARLLYANIIIIISIIIIITSVTVRHLCPCGPQLVQSAFEMSVPSTPNHPSTLCYSKRLYPQLCSDQQGMKEWNKKWKLLSYMSHILNSLKGVV